MKNKDKLVLSVGGMIHKTVLRYRRKDDADYDDLVQQGYLGAMTAADRYDEEKGATFCGFSKDYIRNQIVFYIRENYGLVRLLAKGTGQPYSKIYFNLNKLPTSDRKDVTHSMCVTFAKQIDVDVEDVLDYFNLGKVSGYDQVTYGQHYSVLDDMCKINEIDNIINNKFPIRHANVFSDVMQGNGHSQVAKKYNMSRQWVTEVIKEIREELVE